MGRSGGRSLFLKQLQKYGNRLWQVREQKYVTERETQTKGRTQIWENSWFFAIQKHFFWETRTRNCCFAPQNKFKKKIRTQRKPKTKTQKHCSHSAAGQIPYPTINVETQYGFPVVLIPVREEHSKSKLQVCLYVSPRKRNCNHSPMYNLNG